MVTFFTVLLFLFVVVMFLFLWLVRKEIIVKESVRVDQNEIDGSTW